MLLRKGKIEDEMYLDGVIHAVEKFKNRHNVLPDQIILTYQYCVDHGIPTDKDYDGCVGRIVDIPVYLGCSTVFPDNYVCCGPYKELIGRYSP